MNKLFTMIATMALAAAPCALAQNQAGTISRVNTVVNGENNLTGQGTSMAGAITRRVSPPVRKKRPATPENVTVNVPAPAEETAAPVRPHLPPAESYLKGMEFFRTASYDEAFPFISDAASDGHREAQYRLGYMYNYGLGCDSLPSTAARWYRNAAQQGLPVAQETVAYMYYYGYGVNQNLREAEKWFIAAAEQGMTDSQKNLGFMYNEGCGPVEQNLEEAAKWFTRAAEGGCPEAQCNLGMFYFTPKVFERNLDTAMQWFRRSAEQGIAVAQYNLGILVFNAAETAEGEEEGIEWLRKAAAQGNEDAKRVIEQNFN